MAEEVAAPEAINRDVTSPHQQPENAWRKVSEQLDLLRAVVIQLVSLIMENMVAGPSALTSPGKNDQESAVDILAGASASATAAITRGEKDAQPDAAILGGTGEARTESAILRILAASLDKSSKQKLQGLAGSGEVPAAAEPTAPVPPVLLPASLGVPVVCTPPEQVRKIVPVDGPAS
ncbi:unnamed protein product [Lampetra planeri]